MASELDESIEVDEFSNLCELVDDTNESNKIQNHVISYTASVLEKCIINGRWHKRITCNSCLLAFKEDAVIDDEFVNIKMKTNKMCAPAVSTVQICMATEKAMEKFNFEPGHFQEIISCVHRMLNPDKLFTNTNFSSDTDHANLHHKTELIQMIVQMYVKKKFDYISRCNTLANHDALLRHKLRKFIHFKGQ